MKSQHLLDKVKAAHLIASLLCTLIVFGLIYWGLSAHAPNQGLYGQDGKPATGFLDSIYFGLVTEATLGYGDIRPEGISRLVAAFQVGTGLLLAGIAVAKITSIPQARRRRTMEKVDGLWCDLFTSGNERKILGILHFTQDDGDIRYGGANYDEDANFQGSFNSILVSEKWPDLIFKYDNSQSSSVKLTTGIVELQFHVEGEAIPDSFVGSIRLCCINMDN